MLYFLIKYGVIYSACFVVRYVLLTCLKAWIFIDYFLYVRTYNLLLNNVQNEIALPIHENFLSFIGKYILIHYKTTKEQ